MSTQPITPVMSPILRTPAAVNHARGFIYSLGAIIIGVALWLLILQTGFISSIAVYIMALSAVWLYRKGAGSVDRKSAYLIMTTIVIGVLACLFAGAVSDLIAMLRDGGSAAAQASTVSMLSDSNFWGLAGSVFTDPSFLGAYTSTILWAVGLAALGSYGPIKTIFRQTAPTPQPVVISTKI